AAAARSGLGCTLILGGAEPERSEGNLLLDRIFGAELVFLSLAPDGLTGARLEAEFDRVEASLRARKRIPYRIPAGGSEPLGVAACAVAFHEMLSQMQAARRTPEAVVVSFGTGGTFAGLSLGNIIAGRPARVLGISCAPPGMPAAVGVASTQELIEGGARTLAAILSSQPDRGTPALGPLGPSELREVLAQIRPGDMEIDYSQAGRAYGATTPECLEAIRMTARDEGILLDPVYTSKAMAGLVEMARRSEIGLEGDVVFWHTGGIPGLFPYSAEILRLT
ncbi:MAG TPA: pyridoxal-phosphate dependent enzyme, partial [Candidatus Saccharimonadales bacterium]|nr:pyridoxal-phosphate dependent enzyme [Candidatus Saccharimonadales bacterium]